MDLNDATMTLIESFEGFEPKWYSDPVGVKTIGYGHTDAAGEPKYAKSKSLTLTRVEARELLRRDLKQYADAVTAAVKVPLNGNQYGALVSWTYNVGASAMRGSTLIKKLNAGNYADVPAELAKWNKAKGKVLKGLTRRRDAEAALFAQKPASAPKPVPTPQPAPASTPEPARGNPIGAIIIAAIAAGGAVLVWLFPSIFGGN